MAKHSLREARGRFVRAPNSPPREPRRRVGQKRVSVFERDDIDFDALEADYHNRAILRRDICANYRISASTLTTIVRKRGWRWRSPKPINRHDIIDKLFRLLEAQIEKLEVTMGKTGTAEAGALARLVTSLGRLIDIKDAESARRNSSETRKMSDIKRRLIERIEQLKRG